MAVAFAVDAMDLDGQHVYRFVWLACRACGTRFEYAQLRPGRLPLYCADCAAERMRQRARAKERRKMQRYRQDARAMTRAQLTTLAAEHGHSAMTVGRSVNCLRCCDVLGRRRGPAKSTVWFLEPSATAACAVAPDEPPRWATQQVAAR